jgi:two-component system, OmpR family, phosphate regulon sensor histidine kinase PhoR
MLNNANPKQISFVAAMIVTAIFAAVLYLIESAFKINYNGFIIFNVLIFYLLATYLCFLYFIEKFIYKKIKIIYRTILSHKITPDSLKKEDSDELMEDVENDVLKWVVESQNQIQSLKTLEEYRRNFVGNVSHELRTPIFNIQGFLNTLLDGGLEDANLTERYINRAAQNADRLQIIVDDLETISKLENGNMLLNLESFDIKDLVEVVFSDLEMKAVAKDINLIFKENYKLNFNVKADYESIRRVLDNLIKNSIKYNKKGGTTRIGFYDMDKHILVEVADDGTGISEEHLPFLFDRFYRVDKGRSRNEGGSGLGLSIVKHILEAHKQTIHVRSTIGKGTTFGFTLQKC